MCQSVSLFLSNTVAHRSTTFATLRKYFDLVNLLYTQHVRNAKIKSGIIKQLCPRICWTMYTMALRATATHFTISYTQCISNHATYVKSRANAKRESHVLHFLRKSVDARCFLRTSLVMVCVMICAVVCVMVRASMLKAGSVESWKLQRRETIV